MLSIMHLMGTLLQLAEKEAFILVSFKKRLLEMKKVK